MNLPEISIIIPAHNAADTLDRCIHSVLNQDFNDWELIIVDNLSTDNTTTIVERYATEDSRIILVKEEMKGVSNARNTGLRSAKGKYICFVDADDTIDSNYLSTLYAKRIFDLVLCGYHVDYFKQDGSVIKTEKHSPIPFEQHKLSRYDDRLRYAFENGYIHFCWNKLFHTSIIREHEILFKNAEVNEDYIFVMEYLRHVRSICALQECLYHWIRIENRDSGVLSIPENIIEIYNHSQVLTRDFFQSNEIADKIAYLSYELILYKIYNARKSGLIDKHKFRRLCHELVQNEPAQSSFSAFKSTSRLQNILIYLLRHHMWQIHYLITQKLLK